MTITIIQKLWMKNSKKNCFFWKCLWPQDCGRKAPRNLFLLWRCLWLCGALKFQIAFWAFRLTSTKEVIKKICYFELQNIFYFIFLHFNPSYFQTSWLSHFLFILNDLNGYTSITWSSPNYFGSLIRTKQHTKNFLGD